MQKKLLYERGANHYPPFKTINMSNIKYCNKFYLLSRIKEAKVLSQAVHLANIDQRTRKEDFVLSQIR
jgi:hypothetical protein